MPSQVDRWNAKFEQLKKYRQAEGHCLVPRDDQDLGRWVNDQRKSYKQNGKLPGNREASLDGLGFAWDGRDGRLASEISKWEVRFGELKEYRREHDDCNVPLRYPPNPQLGTWVDNQRSLHRKGKILGNRVDHLKEIKFNWTPRSSNWEVRLEELNKFRREHGHCNVPQQYLSNPQLGTWVARQRAQYRDNTLGNECTRRLDEIEFAWSVGKRRANRMRRGLAKRAKSANGEGLSFVGVSEPLPPVLRAAHTLTLPEVHQHESRVMLDSQEEFSKSKVVLNSREKFVKLEDDIKALRRDGRGGCKNSCRLDRKQKDDVYRKVCRLTTIAAGHPVGPDNEITLDDIKGCIEVKKKMKSLAWLATLKLTQPQLFLDGSLVDSCWRENLVLLGPPGVGKTMLGKAFANERGAYCFHVTTESLARFDVWEKRRLLSLVIGAACALTPSVIFLDEEKGATLSSLLNNCACGCEELADFIKADWWDKKQDVTFIAATTQLYSFDAWALSRLSVGGSTVSTNCYYIPSQDLPVLVAELPLNTSDEVLNELARKANELNHCDDLRQLLKIVRKNDRKSITYEDMCVHLKVVALLSEPRALRSGHQL